MFSFARVRTFALFAASPPRVEWMRVDGTTIAARRDLRIDLIRGLALWMIFVDHLPGNPLARFTYGHFALADALDVFIFLSGISCGLLYGRLVRHTGFAPAQARAFRRAVQLYVGNLFLGFVTVACFFAFRHALTADYIAEYDLALLDREPLRAVGGMFGLLYMPQMMDVLPLYMLLVLVTPSMAWLITRSATVALILSAGLWIAAAAVAQFTLPSLGETGAWALNPFSWQLLFCIGLWAGTHHFVDGVPFKPRRWLLALCWVVIGAGFVARHAGWFFTDPAVLAWVAGAQAKTQVSPVRLLNLLATAYVVAAHLRADSELLRTRWASALRLCGRHSLEVFCTGIAVSVPAGIAVVVYGPTWSVETIATVAGFAAMIAVAWIKDRGRAATRRSIPVGARSRRRRAVRP